MIVWYVIWLLCLFVQSFVIGVLLKANRIQRDEIEALKRWKRR